MRPPAKSFWLGLGILEEESEEEQENNEENSLEGFRLNNDDAEPKMVMLGQIVLDCALTLFRVQDAVEEEVEEEIEIGSMAQSLPMDIPSALGACLHDYVAALWLSMRVVGSNGPHRTSSVGAHAEEK